MGTLIYTANNDENFSLFKGLEGNDIQIIQRQGNVDAFLLMFQPLLCYRMSILKYLFPDERFQRSAPAVKKTLEKQMFKLNMEI